MFIIALMAKNQCSVAWHYNVISCLGSHYVISWQNSLPTFPWVEICYNLWCLMHVHSEKSAVLWTWYLKPLWHTKSLGNSATFLNYHISTISLGTRACFSPESFYSGNIQSIQLYFTLDTKNVFHARSVVSILPSAKKVFRIYIVLWFEGHVKAKWV